MPLFDPDDTTLVEARTLWYTAELLSECSAAQALAESVGDAVATREKVIIGPHAGSWDGDQFTKDELAARFIEFQLCSPIEGGKTVLKSDGTFDRADENGTFILLIRRYARDVELADRSDLYLWFLGQIGKLEQELIANAELRDRPRLLSIQRQQGPAFGAREDTPAQGEYLHTYHTIGWGDYVASE